jgi:hypothetical protein
VDAAIRKLIRFPAIRGQICDSGLIKWFVLARDKNLSRRPFD